MATVITAGNATNGLSLSADNAGTFEFKTGTGAGTTAMTIDASQVVTFAGAASVPGNLSFNSGYGSAAVAYGCRAWVNFSGTGTVTIRASGNVTSITDNGAGDYTVNFITAMPDANYCVTMSGGTVTTNGRICQPVKAAPATTGQRVLFQDGAFTGFDSDYCFVSIFR